MGPSKSYIYLLWLLIAASAFTYSAATPLPEEETAETGVVESDEEVHEIDFGANVDDGIDESAEETARSFIGKIVKQTVKNGGKAIKKVVKQGAKGIAKGTKKIIKNGGKKIIKIVKEGGKKVVKQTVKGIKKVGKQTIKISKQGIKAGGKAVKAQIVKNGKKFVIKGLKQAGKLAAEIAAEELGEALLNQIVGGNDSEEEEEEEEVVEEEEDGQEGDEEEVEDEGDEEGENDEGDDEDGNDDEEEQEVDLMEFLASDDLCECDKKQCECCFEMEGYEQGCIKFIPQGSLWEDDSEVRVASFYGEERAMAHKFPVASRDKKCRVLPKSMFGLEYCVTSNGVMEEKGLKKQCFNLQFDKENSFVKCIAETKSFKLSMASD